MLSTILKYAIECGRLPCGAALPAFGLKQSSLFSQSGIADAEGVKASAMNCVAGEGDKLGRRPSVMGIQTQQFTSPQSHYRTAAK